MPHLLKNCILPVGKSSENCSDNCWSNLAMSFLYHDPSHASPHKAIGVQGVMQPSMKLVTVTSFQGAERYEADSE